MTRPPQDEPTASNPHQVRDQVERTRQELGRTVEALAAKTDIRGRAQEKAAEVKEQAAAKAGELKAEAVRATSRVQDKLPDPVRAQAARGTRLARDNRTVLLAAAGAGVALWLLCRKKR
ncbi:DUF3618 domain-containing protein [Streptomyces sp. NPDC004830]